MGLRYAFQILFSFFFFPSLYFIWGLAVLIVSFAGVFVNLILAIIAVFFLYFITYIIKPIIAISEVGFTAYYVLYYIFWYLAQLNVALAIFNLIPIPPLDGYKIFKELTIGKINYTFFQSFERYSNIIFVLFLIFINRIGLIETLSDYLLELISKVMDLIFIGFI